MTKRYLQPVLIGRKYGELETVLILDNLNLHLYLDGDLLASARFKKTGNEETDESLYRAAMLRLSRRVRRRLAYVFVVPIS